jgi:hypothetical protein
VERSVGVGGPRWNNLPLWVWEAVYGCEAPRHVQSATDDHDTHDDSLGVGGGARIVVGAARTCAVLRSSGSTEDRFSSSPAAQLTSELITGSTSHITAHHWQH